MESLFHAGTHSSKHFGNFDVPLTSTKLWAKLWEFYDSYLKCACKNKQYTPHPEKTGSPHSNSSGIKEDAL